MAQTLSFVKMSGTGNDFVMVDNRTGFIPEDRKTALAADLCDRRRAIGADGLILLEKADSQQADIRMRILNSDGSEAEMCGNGARCFAHFALCLDAAKPKMRIQTMAGIVGADVDDMNVRVELTRPEEIQSRGELEFGGQKKEVWFTNTGVPHAVVFVDDAEAVDVKTWGHDLRFHEAFQPAGANANFVQVVEPGKLIVRTYERGVEDETLACGTGSTAAALIAAARGEWDSPVSVAVRSGEELIVHFEGKAPSYAAAALEGRVTLSFRGETDIDGRLSCR